MREILPLTDKEWERIRDSSFQADEFVKTLEEFDSIRHITGAGEFASIVCSHVQKLKELAPKVFVDGDRECAGEMFLLCSSLGTLMNDVHEWLSDIRIELASLNELAPRCKRDKPL